MFYVYILDRKTKDYYIGYTKDLKRRFSEHSKEYPCSLLYYEAYTTAAVAQLRERRLKQYGSAWQQLKRRLEYRKKAG